MIICILQKGTMGTLLYLNSQEEQIIWDHTAQSDHSQLKPEQGTMLLGTLPGAVCHCPPRLCSCFGFSQTINLHKHPGRAGTGPSGSHTNTRDRAGCTCSLSKLQETGAGGAQSSPFLSCTARSSAQICKICTWPELSIPMTFGGWVRFLAKVKLSSS